MPKMRRGGTFRRIPWMVVGLVGLLQACSESNTTGPVVEGSFTATITGDLELTVTGIAVFGVTTVSGNDGFVVALQRGSASALDLDLILLGRFNTARPGTGTYDIVESGCPTCSDDDFDGGYVLQRTDGTSGIFVSEAGALTITKSTADTVAGTCTFTSRDLTDADTQISISASFVAVQGDLPEVPGT